MCAFARRATCTRSCTRPCGWRGQRRCRSSSSTPTPLSERNWSSSRATHSAGNDPRKQSEQARESYVGRLQERRGQSRGASTTILLRRGVRRVSEERRRQRLHHGGIVEDLPDFAVVGQAAG